MQKLIFSFFIIVVFLIGSISRSILLLNFELRHDYFATELCELKNVPNNSCNGKCYLIKELKAQDEKERKQGSDSQVKFEIFSLAPLMAFVTILENGIDFRFPPYKSKSYLTVISIDFRPPTV